MHRNRWYIVLGIGLLVITCCYFVICGATGYFLGRSGALDNNTSSAVNPSEPTPALTPVQRPPDPIEYETARILAAATLPERDLMDLAHRLQGLPNPFALPTPTNAPEYELGDSMTLWIHDIDTNDHYTSTAILRYETPHAYWWVETGYDLAESNLAQSAQNFEEITYPTTRRIFGSEWNPGIDGDPHVYIFLGNIPGVGGYYSGPDEYPTIVRPHSNEHEMFYINLENALPGNDYFDGVLAHEFQHMIHWAEDRDEDTWVNEGLSELAAQLSGYDVGGSDYVFSQQPDTQLTTWSELEDAAPHYGASYLFMAYILERYGEGAIRQLVAEPANGIDGVNAVLARIDPNGVQFEDLFADWIVANYVDDPNLADGRFGYESLYIERPELAALHKGFPAENRTAVHQYAADYILLEGKEDVTITFTGTQIVPLIGNETHSGEYQWWSNRGDEGDATLTRAFDLSGLEQATLQAWMWYHLEEDYDYAYVEVSTDGGDTWDILANEHTTTDNPSGNSYGAALNGASGGGDEPEWVLETFDLTPYAGQQVLVRFEVVTDEALNYPGLALDDLAIPELGYSHDVEEGDDGWQAEGWVRVTDHVPQDFVVQVITFGSETRIERMPLDENRRGTMTIPGMGDDVERAVLIISAIAPATTEWAAYEYQITQE
jgi:hypothetical protein